jgi:hypothetical protein
MPNNLIHFPSTPPFQSPRKRGALKDAEKKQAIVSNLPALMPTTHADIVRMWRRQVRIQLIAKIHQLTVGQVEAVLWLAFHGSDGPVQMRRAA